MDKKRDIEQNVGFPRGIKGKTFYEGPNTIGPVPIEDRPEPSVKPFGPCLDELVGRLSPEDQHLVRLHTSILSGERFPKSSQKLAERLERIVSSIERKMEVDPEGDNKSELLELFAIFASHYIHYI